MITDGVRVDRPREVLRMPFVGFLIPILDQQRPGLAFKAGNKAVAVL